MKDKKNIFTVYGLNELLDKEEKIIIYGVGDYGKRVADYIISEKKKDKIECFCVTENKGNTDYKGIKIVNFGDGYLAGSDNLIITAMSETYLSEIAEILHQYGKRYCCVTHYLYDDLGRKLNSDVNLQQISSYEDMDFLLAGFIKCGTSSLHKALMKIEDVYVPEGKASLFFDWCDQVKNPKEQLIRDYFNKVQEKQIVGMYEPSFAKYPRRTREFLGGRIKILFLVRNPVRAMFSAFKMAGRNGTPFLRRVYEKYGGVYEEKIFDECLNNQQLLNRFKYIDHIQQFIECYSSNQIKIIFFEELIKNTQEVMNDMLQFIGSCCKYTEKELSKENEGNYVMADIEGLEIANRLGKLKNEYAYFREVSERSDEEILNELAEVERQYAQAEKIYDIRLSETLRKKLEAYYNDSVRELEKLLDKDLSEIWF